MTAPREKSQPAQVDMSSPEGQAFLMGELQAEVSELKVKVATHQALIQRLTWRAVGGAGLVVAAVEGVARLWL